MNKFRLSALILSIVLIILVGLSCTNKEKTKSINGVTEARFNKMKKGVSPMFWFWMAKNEEAIKNGLSDEELSILNKSGLGHIRLPIDFWVLYDSTSVNHLNKTNLGYLDNAIERLKANEIAVFIDIHTIAKKGVHYSIIQEPEFQDKFIAFWSSLAKHLSSTDPEWVFLEPLNEPVFRNKDEEWAVIQERLVTEIRKQAPEHTIVATCTFWSNYIKIPDLKPVSIDNVVYNFHFYEPWWFTHQGCTWSELDLAQRISHLPYPGTLEAAAPALEEFKDDEEAINLIMNYVNMNWNATKIDSCFNTVAQWANNHQVPVICNEFSSVGKHVPHKDGMQWINDTRSALENNNIGWSYWTFRSLVKNKDGKPIVNKDVAKALGLIPNETSMH